ncbi:hypothetical protein HOLleu_23460 [Holothuria leucospilota]|uniref:Uncharacterized protein n=1 Tax=Holothuria leucospilota TaxID=206669 RepID=A0A9Q1BV23_HOLLE|nr:hypothetical protein HOLleu_23460 [Holothuria leucospilota]
MTEQCRDYGLRNVKDDEGGDWQLYNFTDIGKCFICFRGTTEARGAELVLPCLNHNQQRVKRIVVSYVFRRSGNANGGSEITLSDKISKTCTVDNSTDTQLGIVDITASEFRGNGAGEDKIEITIEQGLHSYRLKTSGHNPNSIICLTRVQRFTTTDTTTPTPSTATEFNRATKGQARSTFSPWLPVLLVLAIIIGISAVTGIVIYQRKLQKHQQDEHVNASRVGVQSREIEINKRHNKDVIPNPTYNRDLVNEKDEEYHSYTEIDIREATACDMVYNSAYER